MILIKKLRVILVTAIAIMTAGLVGAGVAHAQASPPVSSLVQKLAERFGLKQEEVQQVFDQFHEEKRGQMEAKWEERLSQAVSEGKITEEQKLAIIVKHQEVRQEMMELKDKSPEERRAEMKKLHEELKTWAEQNNIDLKIFGPFNHGFKKGFRMGYMIRKH